MAALDVYMNGYRYLRHLNILHLVSFDITTLHSILRRAVGHSVLC